MDIFGVSFIGGSTVHVAPQPKDHSRTNRGRIRQLAERGRRKREEVDSSAPPLPSSSSTGKYSHVPSKVCSNLEVSPEQCAYLYVCV